LKDGGGVSRRFPHLTRTTSSLFSLDFRAEPQWHTCKVVNNNKNSGFGGYLNRRC
jgi:hypothetical protein